MPTKNLSLSSIQALALMYTQKRSTKEDSPEDLCELYFYAYYKIAIKETSLPRG